MQKPLEVIELMSGLEGWSAGFRDRGHHTTALDLDPRFGADLQMDILNLNALGKRYDVILASPPCETFSVMTIGKYWTGGRGAYEPKNDRARHGLAIMHKTFALIDAAKPRFYVIENPRGVMRKVAPRPPTTTTWYCRWGKTYAKPTDLWTSIQGEFPACRNNDPDHLRAPRGSRTGVQGEGKVAGWADALSVGATDGQVRHDYQPAGYQAKKAAGGLGRGVQMDASPKKAALRAIIPYRLSLAVALAAERGGVLPPMDDVRALEAVYRPAQRAMGAA